MQMTDALLDKFHGQAPTWELSVQGPWNQWRHIENALAKAEQDRDFLTLGAGLLFWGWQERPWNTRFLELLPVVAGAAGLLDAKATTLVREFQERLLFPSDPEEWNKYQALEDQDAIRDFLLPRMSDPEAGLFWLCLGFDRCLESGAVDHARELLEAFPSSSAMAPWLARLRAEWAQHALPPQEARPHVESLDPRLFPWWREYILGRLALAEENREETRTRYAWLWHQMPWHVNLALTLYELEQPIAPPPTAMERDNTHVLLYSWNKAELLGRTLDSLAKSRLGAAKVIVLDNGSSDDTGAMLRGIQGSWGSNGFQVVELPVNVGAPAARNWLLSLPEVQASDWIAFLDDDILLPENWLEGLFQTMERRPDAGAAGCAIVNENAPHAMQGADFHLMPPTLGLGNFTDLKERFLVFNNCIGLRDGGLFEYIRPCLSVSGCCHLLRGKFLRETGNFDIRFNPSQFDDLERDIRSCLAGHPSVCHGGLRVRHVQHSSLKQADSRAKSAHIAGNKIKLEYKYSPMEAREILRATNEMVRKDLRDKMGFLGKQQT